MQEYTSIDDENRSSLQLRLAHTLAGSWSIEGRAAIWRNVSAGDDAMAVTSTSFRHADGGSGIGVLRLMGSGLTLDLTALANNRTAGIERVAFDRAGFAYHGRIKALADAAREAGLQF